MTAIKRWSSRHDAAIQALLTSPSIRGAADRAGVSERHLRRWLQDGLFMDRLTMAQAEVHDAALGEIRSLAADAVKALRRALHCDDPAVELRAAVSVLDLGFKITERESTWEPSLRQVEQWLASIERRSADRNGERPPWIE
jgi:hypothetical protein